MLPADFLIAAAVGLAFIGNAVRPLPWTFLSLPSFFAGWLTGELAPQILVVHVAVIATLVGLGAVHGWQGWTGLGLAVGTGAGLVRLIVLGHRVRHVVEDALAGGLGPDYASRILPRRAAQHDLRVPWRQLLLPFWMRHPDVERVRKIPYGPHGRRNRLDVYRHRSRPSGCPTLVQVHGGGWVTGNKDNQGRPLLLHLASRGWVCFSINYRLSPRASWPDHIVDVKRALAWIREHGAELGADPGFVLVTGGSAGGHLAALLALTPGEYQPGFEGADTSVQACVPYYGVYDLTNTLGTWQERGLVRFLEHVVFKRSFRKHREEFERASPLLRVSEEAPAFFVIHGTHDSLVAVEEARTFVAKLRERSKQPVVYAELPGAQHAFDVFPSIRTAHVIRAVERFADYLYSQRASARPDGARLAAD